MRKANIALGLTKLRAVQVVALMNNVVAKMTGNANFTTPEVPLADMQAKADALEVAIEQATEGSKQSRLNRDLLIRDCRKLLNKQADYVRSICEGDANKLQSSGFTLARNPHKVGIPGTARNMVARATTLHGQAELRWRHVHGAQGYQVWMAEQDPAEGGSWRQLAYTVRASHLVEHLESYKAYWFCVSAIGTAGEGPQCDPALCRAA